MFKKVSLIDIQNLETATDEKYPVLNRENLTIRNQTQLSQKKKTPFLSFLLDF